MFGHYFHLLTCHHSLKTLVFSLQFFNWPLVLTFTLYKQHVLPFAYRIPGLLTYPHHFSGRRMTLVVGVPKSYIVAVTCLLVVVLPLHKAHMPVIYYCYTSSFIVFLCQFHSRLRWHNMNKKKRMNVLRAHVYNVTMIECYVSLCECSLFVGHSISNPHQYALEVATLHSNLPHV